MNHGPVVAAPSWSEHTQGVSMRQKLQFEPVKMSQKGEDLDISSTSLAGTALVPVMSIPWLKICNSNCRLQRLAFRVTLDSHASKSRNLSKSI